MGYLLSQLYSLEKWFSMFGNLQQKTEKNALFSDQYTYNFYTGFDDSKESAHSLKMGCYVLI